MTEAERALRRRRLLLWGLAASLTLNGFLVGLVATSYLSDDRRRGTLYFETRSISRNLPEAEREDLISSVRALLPELREKWRELRRLRREINRIVAEPEPDRAAIDERLARIRAITADVQATVQNQVFEEVLEFPSEVRAAIPRQEEDGR